MADIQPEINAFKSAVYGEDVRDAMVSLANKINDDIATKDASQDESVATVSHFLSEILSSELVEVSSSVMTPSAVNANYELAGNGNRQYQPGKEQRLYPVKAGQKLYIKQGKETPGTFQFQSAGGSSVDTLIGTAHKVSFEGFLIVPSGATYLCTSQMQGNTADSVSLVIGTIATEITDITNDYTYSRIHEGWDKVSITWVNGTPPNGGNRDYISTREFDVSPGDVLKIVPLFALGEYDLIVGVYFYDDSGTYASPTASGSTGINATQYMDTFVVSDNSAVKARICIGKSAGGTVSAVRVEDFQSAPALILRSTISPIIERNMDVELQVLSAAGYGKNQSGVANRNKNFAMLIASDLHGSLPQMRNAVDYLNEMECIVCGISLGDMASSNFTSVHEWYTSQVQRCKKPWYTVIGNHDGGNSAQASISGSKQQVFDKYVKPTRNIMGIPSLTKTYYSVNFQNFPITLVVLDIYDVPDTLLGSGDFAVGRNYEALSQEQLDWFVSTLMSIPAGNHLVVAKHSGGFYNTWSEEECPWTKPGSTIQGTGTVYESPIVNEVIQAWRTGSLISKTYTPSQLTEYMPTLTVSANFGTRGSGVFACHLTGHSHFDTIAHDENDQLIVQVDTSANDNYNPYFSDLPRYRFTKAEDCLTVLGIDTVNRIVKLVRVGSNVTDHMTKRDMIALPY